ncbi:MULTISPECIES: HNH endonuclease family protein [Amycolatopsis]|uniref:HNH endonuclease family protein n=2 Tax=Amycolatopsis TaxID=1813 RepID=A0ABP7J1E3_9PSEU|nr:HNH endonuclease family protein [Amycolatopsis tucumanensis]MCF6422244.1 HNH endonuclease family protein [Amycolatopsis tucumanensis]
MPTRTLPAALLAVALLATTACEVPGSDATVAEPPAASASLAGLPIAPEDTGAHYDRDDWPHWSTVHGTCNAREQALLDQGHGVRADDECRPIAGTWVSAYDGVTVTDPAKLDIDHLVPLAEVARSGRIENGRRVGPRQWSRAERERYANDPDVLVVATARANRSKGDSDPAHWLPERDRCSYALRWVEIKTRYRLSIDQAEHDALAAVMTHCRNGGDR